MKQTKILNFIVLLVSESRRSILSIRRFAQQYQDHQAALRSIGEHRTGVPLS